MTPTFSLSEMAAMLNAEVRGPQTTYVGVSDLKTACKADLSVYFSRQWREIARATQAGIVIVEHPLADNLPDTCTRLIVPHARTAWSAVLRWVESVQTVRPAGHVHPSCIIAETATIDPSACISPLCVIGEHTQIGRNVNIAAGCVVGDGAIIGDGTTMGSSVTIHAKTRIGKACFISDGARIGTVGFGIDADGLIPHLGHVVIGDFCTIGANVCIDRATVTTTAVGMASHIDNLVQIGHNVTIGQRVRLCGQVGIAGGATLEDDVWVGGQAGIGGHLTIGQGARIAAKSGVTKSLPGGLSYSGFPAEPNMQRLRKLAAAKRASKQ
ncbi:MAG: UDP-3-O-(3-hydroxymyristoyl)glucosamine N-acyltransferase [Myxococcota bacterium]|nr:UDP-3-O-(3-hydroxymyristoyl)glucosamine N-acyltransferase [Myxococcota bacterium]